MKKRICILIQFLALTSLFWCAELNAQSKECVVVTAENPMGGGGLLLADSLQVTQIDSLKILPADSLQILPIDSLKVLSVDSLKVLPVDTLQVLPVDSLQVLPVDTLQVLPVDTLKVLPVDTLQVLPVDTLKVFPVDTLQVLPVDTLQVLPVDSLQVLPVDSLKVSPIDTLKLSYCDSLVNVRIDTLNMSAVDSARMAAIDSLKQARWCDLYNMPCDSSCMAVADSIMGLPDTLRNSRTIFALKTNLLYDLATVVNYSLEVPIGNRVSILFQHYIPWWRTSNNKYCLELQSLGAEARFWIKPKENERLSGHFLGLYGLSGTTDLQYDRKLDIQAKFWSAGLTYGYSFVLNHSLRLELSISGGYLRAPLTQYFPADDYSILFRDVDFHNTLTWIGPTKVEVSFVWSINAAKKNKSKEGRQ